MSNKPVTIMLVDDDRVDTAAIRRSFKELKVSNPIVTARDGLEALEMLKGEGGREKTESPMLILLDLSMPRMNGHEFLDALRADPTLRQTPVFVMTTSSSSDDRARAYANNVAGYLLKYQAGQEFVDAISMLEHYWTINSFPD
jgi:CheY-like chemotaxis protein